MSQAGGVLAPAASHSMIPPPPALTLFESHEHSNPNSSLSAPLAAPPPPPPPQAASHVLSLIIAHSLSSAGFTSAPRHLLLILTTLLEEYLSLLLTTSEDLAQSTGRRRPVVGDVLEALEDLVGDDETDMIDWLGGLKDHYGRGLGGVEGRNKQQTGRARYGGLEELKRHVNEGISMRPSGSLFLYRPAPPEIADRDIGLCSVSRYSAKTGDDEDTDVGIGKLEDDDVDMDRDGVDEEGCRVHTKEEPEDDEGYHSLEEEDRAILRDQQHDRDQMQALASIRADAPWLPPFPGDHQPQTENMDVDVDEDEALDVPHRTAELAQADIHGDPSHPYLAAPARFDGEDPLIDRLHSRKRPSAPLITPSTLPSFLDAVNACKRSEVGPTLAYRKYRERAAQILAETSFQLPSPSPLYEASRGNPIVPNFPVRASGQTLDEEFDIHPRRLPKHLLGLPNYSPLIDLLPTEMSGVPGLPNDQSPWINADLLDQLTHVKPPDALKSTDGPVYYGDPERPTWAPGQSAPKVTRGQGSKITLSLEDGIQLHPTWDIGQYGDWSTWVGNGTEAKEGGQVLSKGEGKRLDPALVQTVSEVEAEAELEGGEDGMSDRTQRQPTAEGYHISKLKLSLSRRPSISQPDVQSAAVSSPDPSPTSRAPAPIQNVDTPEIDHIESLQNMTTAAESIATVPAPLPGLRPTLKFKIRTSSTPSLATSTSTPASTHTLAPPPPAADALSSPTVNPSDSLSPAPPSPTEAVFVKQEPTD